MKIIDAHMHFWNYDANRHGWINDDMQVIRKDFLPGDAEQIFQKLGIEGCVAVQADTTEAETEFLVQLSQQHKIIKGVVGWVDLATEDLEEKLLLYSKQPIIKGFREIMQGAPDEQFMTNENFQAGLKQLAPLGFTYDVLIYHNQLPSAIKFTEKYPDQDFILDHIAKPNIKQHDWKKWRDDIRELSKNPKMYCKISGMVTEADWQRWNYENMRPYLETVGEYFGTDRICFGSDWPVCLVAAKYQDVLKIVTEFLSEVPVSEREQVLSGNITRFYKLN
jgi:L-fuconolactonase